MIRRERPQLRLLAAAALVGQEAARLEPAAGRDVLQVDANLILVDWQRRPIGVQVKADDGPAVPHEAQARGFDNAIVCDMLGNVAEFATSNVFMAKDGVVFTPLPNGTFLAGITRQRVMGLLRESGVTVVEKTLTYQDFEKADEIFSTGNYSKVVPVIRIGDRSLPFGPLYTKARKLYWEFAHSSPVHSATVGSAASPGD